MTEPSATLAHLVSTQTSKCVTYQKMFSQKKLPKKCTLKLQLKFHTFMCTHIYHDEKNRIDRIKQKFIFPDFFFANVQQHPCWFLRAKYN